MSTNSHPQQHEMRLEKTYPSGAQEWFCPTCARRFIAQWQPTINIIALEAGDSRVGHTGSTGDLRMRPLQIRQVEEPMLSDELRAALEEALEDVDLDDWLGTVD
jgi:hypothetical protein